MIETIDRGLLSNQVHEVSWREMSVFAQQTLGFDVLNRISDVRVLGGNQSWVQFLIFPNIDHSLIFLLFAVL